MTDTHAQLIDLQIKIAYLDNTVDDLNAVITSQTLQIKDLQDQLKLIYRYLQNQHGNDDGIAPFDLLADKPPHY
ncbi:SlyX family protein [Moraxella nasibovis]|uniref:SlyX family protein n=1 Tax=Moraxella nasibovis TaxID=2904120 RepID=UPI0024102F68|nr:SlyX family protein [Moraxella nasibovis]WFF39637.1 SlyX family protein [Moraxella nasibovis]